MKNPSYLRISQSCNRLSSLGQVHSRSLFGGYSLSIDNTVFAMVSDGELYLRACEENAAYFIERKLPVLTFSKRGRAVSLNYYQVDDILWRDPALFIQLSEKAFISARQEKEARDTKQRIKDLPNLTLTMELKLWEAGIRDIQTLKNKGAKACWVILRQQNRDLGLRVLFALEGAIVGMHAAALPAERRRELKEWMSQHLEQEAQARRCRYPGN